MSPDRIEGTYYADRFDQMPQYDWYLVKPATGKSENTISNAKSDTTISNVTVNEKEPWTGKFKLESNNQCSGIWAMKQEGQIVKSTRDSAYEFNGRVHGNQLNGNFGPTYGQYSPFNIEMHSDSMSFKGSLDYFGSLRNNLKGKRIE